MLILKISLILVLLKVLQKSHRPFLCAIFYTLGILTNGLIFDFALGTTALHVIVVLADASLLSSGWFFLLNEFEDSGTPYWSVLIFGLSLLLWAP